MRAVLTFLFAGLNFFASANFDFNADCKKAYGKILEFDFTEANTLIAAEKAAHPENKIPLLLGNYIDFLTVIIGEEKKEFNGRKENKQSRLSEIEQGDANSPWYLYSKAEINLQWAFSRIKFNEYITAAFEINKAYSMLKENEKKFPAFSPNKKNLGLLHALVGTIPDEYSWAVNLMGFEGTIKQGVGELKSLHESLSNSEYGFLETETLFLLAFVETNLAENEQEMKKLLEDIEKTGFSSPLLIHAGASLALHLGQNGKAVSILEKYTGGSFHYLDYLYGMALLHKLDASAKKYFEKYIQNFRGMNYIRSANQKLGWCCLISGDSASAKKYFTKVKAAGATLVDEDKQAMKECAEGKIPNVVLLKARLLFDGGYYMQSLSMLIETKPSGFLKTKHDHLEFIYRLARIHQKLGNNDRSAAYYEMVIKEGETLPYYFASNAALQLGLMYEEQENKQAAKKYFEKTLSMRSHEYQNSIDQKAKAGLSRLKN